MPYDRNSDIPDLDDLNESLFFMAASDDDVEAFKELLGRGLDPTAPDINGETAISRVFQENSLGVFELLVQCGVSFPAGAACEAAGRGNAQMLRRLLDLGYNVHGHDSKGWTALMSAALGAHTEEVGILIEAGASVNEQDSSGRAPLHHAAAVGSTSVIRLLLTHGARSDLVDSFGCKPVDVARENGNDLAVHLLSR